MQTQQNQPAARSKLVKPLPTTVHHFKHYHERYKNLTYATSPIHIPTPRESSTSTKCGLRKSLPECEMHLKREPPGRHGRRGRREAQSKLCPSKSSAFLSTPPIPTQSAKRKHLTSSSSLPCLRGAMCEMLRSVSYTLWILPDTPNTSTQPMETTKPSQGRNSDCLVHGSEKCICMESPCVNRMKKHTKNADKSVVYPIRPARQSTR